MTAAVSSLVIFTTAAYDGGRSDAATRDTSRGLGTPALGAAGDPRATGTTSARAPEPPARPVARCSAHKAVRFYAARIRESAAKLGVATPRGAGLSPTTTGRLETPRQPCPRYLAKRLRAKAYAWRARWERFRTLRDFDVRPGYSGWQLAVDEVQRAFPGTKAWLLSCSASEGGWGRWVRYGGGPYYPGLERRDVSGGWLQFKPPTFAGFYRHAVDDVRSRGFRVRRLEALPTGWLSPLSQALAAAWGYRNGLAWHWAGRGC